MKVGELVIYEEGTKQFNALVLGERNVADHAGKDGEPLLTLVFAKERLDAFGNPLPLHGTGQQSGAGAVPGGRGPRLARVRRGPAEKIRSRALRRRALVRGQSRRSGRRKRKRVTRCPSTKQASST